MMLPGSSGSDRSSPNACGSAASTASRASADGSGRTVVAVYDLPCVSVRAENTVLVTGSYDQSPPTLTLCAWAGSGSQCTARLPTRTDTSTVGPTTGGVCMPFLTGVAGGASNSCG